MWTEGFCKNYRIATTLGGTMLEIKYKPKPEKEEQVKSEDLSDNMVLSENIDTETDSGEENEESKEETIIEQSEAEQPVKRKRRSSVQQNPGDTLDGTAEPLRKRSGNLKKIILGFFVLVFAVVLTFGFSLWREYSRKDVKNGKEIEVTIEQGSSTREVGTVLKDAGVIRYELPFLMKMYFSDYKGKLRYGTFKLNDGMSLDTIVKTLATGGALKEEQSFTIPEGYSVKMIANKLEKEKIMTAEEFLTAVDKASENFVYAQNLPAKEQVFYQLEGYLFPDTYYLSENMTGDELVAKILEEFNQKFDASRQEAATALGMSVEEVLIRASLVQKETERPEEYPTIAGVINNRLAKNMNLQFDSTVVYAMTEGLYGVDRVLYDHLKTESPYNTYLNKGLPVGPICNPSLEAIDGVLHPEENEYLYFQTDAVKNDGSNLYFKTYEEHAAAAATTETPQKETAPETTTQNK